MTVAYKRCLTPKVAQWFISASQLAASPKILPFGNIKVFTAAAAAAECSPEVCKRPVDSSMSGHLCLDEEQLQDLCPLMTRRHSQERKGKASFLCLKNVHIFRTRLFLRGLFSSASFKHNAVIFRNVFFPSQTSCAVDVKEKMKCLHLCLRSTKAFLCGDRWYIFSLRCFHR